MKKKSVRLLVLFTLLLLSACGCQRKKDEQANRLVKDLKANVWVIEGTDSTDDPKMTLTFSNRKASFNLNFSSIDYSVDDESNSVHMQKFIKQFSKHIKEEFRYTIKGDIMTWKELWSKSDIMSYKVSKKNETIILTPLSEEETTETKNLVLIPYKKNTK